jgi:hypothetical protein
MTCKVVANWHAKEGECDTLIEIMRGAFFRCANVTAT